MRAARRRAIAIIVHHALGVTSDRPTSMSPRRIDRLGTGGPVPLYAPRSRCNSTGSVVGGAQVEWRQSQAAAGAPAWGSRSRSRGICDGVPAGRAASTTRGRNPSLTVARSARPRGSARSPTTATSVVPSSASRAADSHCPVMTGARCQRPGVESVFGQFPIPVLTRVAGHLEKHRRGHGVAGGSGTVVAWSRSGDEGFVIDTGVVEASRGAGEIVPPGRRSGPARRRTSARRGCAVERKQPIGHARVVIKEAVP